MEPRMKGLKSDLCVKEFDDRDVPLIVHATSVFRLSSIWVILSSAAYNGVCIFSHDVTQAYVQSNPLFMCNSLMTVKLEDKIIFGIKEDEVSTLNSPYMGFVTLEPNEDLR